uniref:Retron EC67 protein n=1 Tax=Lygus hesperus TaxID=30085 RepID=A0A0A9WSZ8_LYGHE
MRARKELKLHPQADHDDLTQVTQSSYQRVMGGQSKRVDSLHHRSVSKSMLVPFFASSLCPSGTTSKPFSPLHCPGRAKAKLHSVHPTNKSPPQTKTSKEEDTILQILNINHNTDKMKGSVTKKKNKNILHQRKRPRIMPIDNNTIPSGACTDISVSTMVSSATNNFSATVIGEKYKEYHKHK